MQNHLFWASNNCWFIWHFYHDQTVTFMQMSIKHGKLTYSCLAGLCNASNNIWNMLVPIIIKVNGVPVNWRGTKRAITVKSVAWIRLEQVRGKVLSLCKCISFVAYHVGGVSCCLLWPCCQHCCDNREFSTVDTSAILMMKPYILITSPLKAENTPPPPGHDSHNCCDTATVARGVSTATTSVSTFYTIISYTIIIIPLIPLYPGVVSSLKVSQAWYL